MNRERIIIERFDDLFFRGLTGYNKLMLSVDFYKRFLHYEYILICQTDAFVFKNELLFWTDKGYDYIGAPWIGRKETFVSRFNHKVTEAAKRLIGIHSKEDIRLYKVGNGGFSLRKVKTFYDVLRNNDAYLKNLYLNEPNSIFLVEDMFFSFAAPQLNSNFLIPNYKEAVSFAIDRKPKHAIQINGGNLPFACHRFNYGKNGLFWKPIIKNILSGGK